MCLLVSRCWSFIPFIIFLFGSTESSIRLDLMRQPPLLQRMADSGMSPLQAHEHLMAFYSKNSTVYEPLFKALDSEFYGEILIGHPGQKFKVSFDTSWADTWVPSILCPVQFVACTVHNRYNSRKSSTYIIDDRQIVINDSEIYFAGKFSIDLFHFGQVNITNQTFIEMTDIPFLNSFYKNDGTVGLGFNNLAHGEVTVFDNMAAQGKISNKLFSLYLNRDPRSKKGGTLLFGDIDKTHYLGDLTYVDVVSSQYWAFNMTSLMVKGRTTTDYCKGNCHTIIDSSTNTIKGPSSCIDQLSLSIDSQAFLFGRYMVPCSSIQTLPSITLTIGNRQFTLKAKDYVQIISWEGFQLCLTTFQKTNFGNDFPKNTWILGGPFLSRYYSVFDAGSMKIAFADARL